MKTLVRPIAIEGPNGWYVGCPNAEGIHYQPDGGGDLTREQAERAAKLAPRYCLDCGEDEEMCFCDALAMLDQIAEGIEQ